MIAVLRLILHVNKINEHIERKFNLNRSNNYQMFFNSSNTKEKIRNTIKQCFTELPTTRKAIKYNLVHIRILIKIGRLIIMLKNKRPT